MTNVTHFTDFFFKSSLSKFQLVELKEQINAFENPKGGLPGKCLYIWMLSSDYCNVMDYEEISNVIIASLRQDSTNRTLEPEVKRLWKIYDSHTP